VLSVFPCRSSTQRQVLPASKLHEICSLRFHEKGSRIGTSEKYTDGSYYVIYIIFFKRNIHQGRPSLWILLKRKQRKYNKETRDNNNSCETS
jgi:hypothetical protein